MEGLVLKVLPLALGASLSPALLTLELGILAGRTKPKARASVFALSAAVTIFVFGLVVVAFLRNINIDQPPSWASVVVRGALAVGLATLGIRFLVTKKQPGQQHHARLRARLTDAGLPFFMGLGVAAMLTNASTLVLYLPAVHLIMHTDVSLTAKVVVGLMLWIITILPFMIPIVLVAIAGHRSDAFLLRLNHWATTNSRRISASICLLFAALLTYSAIEAALALK